MTREEELFARVVAQQQQITALHTVLTTINQAYSAMMSAQARADINAALGSCEPSSRAQFEAAVAEAIEPRVKMARDELVADHDAKLAAKDEQISRLSRGGRGGVVEELAKGEA